MSDALSLVEIEGQHGELLPARTELQWAISLIPQRTAH